MGSLGALAGASLFEEIDLRDDEAGDAVSGGGTDDANRGARPIA